MARSPRILLIDDDVNVLVALKAALETEGNLVETITEADEGLHRAQQEEFDVVVTDLNWDVPGSKRLEQKGIDLIDRLHQAQPSLPIILMTAYPAIDTTIDATKRGAYDYITKPGNYQEMDELVNTVRKAITSREQQKSLEPAPSPSLSPAPHAGIEVAEVGEIAPVHYEIRGKSRAMQRVLKAIGRIAAKPVTVLICGETGTGKELVARALHEHSDRANKPFVIVNCVAIPEALLESELFGHEQGAFTGATSGRVGRFEQAQGGTLFLDEIGDMMLSTQSKLLRVLQDKTVQRLGARQGFQVNVRVIAATHRDLDKAVENREFRQDLFYRLNDAVIRLPPLRERREDIPELVNFFIQQYAAQLGATGSQMDPEALRSLQRHPWPGNVRELASVVRKALLLARGGRIDLAIIRKMLEETSFFRRPSAATGATATPAEQSLSAHISDLLDAAEERGVEGVAAALVTWAEREIFTQVFRLAQGDQRKAAEWLGVSRPTVREKFAKYGLLPGVSQSVPEPHAV
jgi:DNA-binding NtrC family response regulator